MIKNIIQKLFEKNIYTVRSLCKNVIHLNLSDDSVWDEITRDYCKISISHVEDTEGIKK